MSEMDREKELKDLMLETMKGNHEAYQIFLREISLIARAYLLKRCAHLGKDRVDDLIQEVLMAIHAKKSSYRTDLPILPWIFTITRHKMIDEIRAQQRKNKLSDAFSEELPHLTDDVMEERENLEDLISGMSERQREILIMAKVKEIPLGQISEHFKMSLSAVKVSIHRAIKSLKGDL